MSLSEISYDDPNPVPAIASAHHRDKGSKIDRKYGNTLVSMLRRRFGEAFAKGECGGAKLGDILYRLDELSLSRLVRNL